MSIFLLHHRHRPDECAASFAAWEGFRSPLRGSVALSSCLAGEHQVWWRVEAADADGAMALLPRYVAERSCALSVRETEIP
jgi:hypothetical protein